MNHSEFPGIRNLYEENKMIHRFSIKAMATIFEIFIFHPDKIYAAQAADAAFMELDRLEQELSRFVENSEISRINSLTKFEKLTLSIDVFNCLEQCNQLYQDTKGAFDISTALLTDLWRNRQKLKGSKFRNEDVQHVMKQLGLPWLQIDHSTHQATLMNEAIHIDLGGFGKGYAIDRMIVLLEEWGIKSGLIQGGRSTVCAFGIERDNQSWPLSISHPLDTNIIIEKIDLSDRALSGSGLQKGQHIIDPRNGYPAENNLASWTIAPQAATSDALSTAFMVMSIEQIEDYCLKHSQTGGIVLENNDQHTLHKIGEW